MLYNGERVGDGSGPEWDIAVDPVDGTTLTAKSLPDAVSVLGAVAAGHHVLPRPGRLHAEARRAPAAVAGAVDLDAPIADIVAKIAKASDRESSELTVAVLDRPRHADWSPQIRAAGRPDPVPARRRRRRRDHGRHPGEPGSTCWSASAAPRRACSPPAALRCLGGEMFGRLIARDDDGAGGHPGRRLRPGPDPDHHATSSSGDNVFFAATGVTDGALLRGVRFEAPDHHPVAVDAVRSGTVRLIEGRHDPERSAASVTQRSGADTLTTTTTARPARAGPARAGPAGGRRVRRAGHRRRGDRCGAALDAVTRGLRVGLVEARDLAAGTSSRSSKLFHGGLRYLEQLNFALVFEALKERSLALNKLAPHLAKPVPFLYPLTKPVIRPRLRRAGHRGLRRDGRRPGRAAPSAPPQPQAQDPGVRSRRPTGRRRQGLDPVLRGPGRRRPAHHDDRPHRRPLRRARWPPAPGSSGFCARTTGSPASGSGTWSRGEEFEIRARQIDQRRRGLDRRAPGDARRPRPVPGPRLQGHPPGRAAEPDQLPDRPDHPDREEPAVHHPLGQPLDHRHHRHRLGPGPGPSGGEPGRHRLPARPRQHAAGRPADPRRRGRRLRRAAAAAGRRVRLDLASCPGSTRSPPRCAA